MSPAAEGLGQRRRRWHRRRQSVPQSSTAATTAAAALVLLGLAVACSLVPALAWLCVVALCAVAAAGFCWGYRGTELPSGPRLALSQDVRLNGVPGQRSRVWQQQVHQQEEATQARALEFSPVDPSLMGSYLCRSEAPTAGARPRDIRARLAKPTPAVPSPTKRLSFGESQTVANRYMIPRRRYPIRQLQYSALGSLPMVQWDGYQRKNVLSSKNSYMVHSPVTVKIAPLDVNFTRSQVFDQLLSPVLTQSPKNIPDPCARETVLNAIKDCRKRVVEEEEQSASSGQENKRRRHDSSGSGQSAFESLVANGAPAYLIPKPGSLKRSLNSQYVEDPLNKRSRTSSSSSLNSTRGILSSVRNAITSSYSSTQGFQQKWKKNVQSTSALSSLSSSRSETPERPAKKSKEDELQQSCTSPPVKAAVTESPPGKVLPETPVLKKPNSVRSPSSPESGGKRKRKIPLLPSRRGDPLSLPPPPQLGRSVTAEDLDAEKRTAIQRLNKALEEKSNDNASSAIEAASPGSSLSFTPVTTSTSAQASQPSSASTNPLLESLKKIQNTPASTEPASEATQTPKLLTSIFSSSSNATLGTCSLTVTPSNSKSLTSTSVSIVPSASEPTSITSLQMPAALSSETPDTKLPSTSSPKHAIPFGMPSGAAPNSAFVSVPPPSTAASPTFKSVFEVLPKVENPLSPLVSSSEACSAPSSSTTGIATNTTFRPIFGNLNAAANSSTVISPFMFNQTPAATVNAASAAAPTTSSSTHSGLLSAVCTTSSAVGSSITQSSIIDSTAKPSFNFGRSSAPSVTAANTTVAHSFQFGVLSNPTASTAAGFGAGFQFNKPPVATTVSSTASPQPTSVFDQAPPAGTKAAFSIFGSNSTVATTTSISQPHLTLGSSTSAFSVPSVPLPFGTGANAPPPYPGTTGQPNFSNSTADAQQVGSKSATDSLNFSTSTTPFSFGMSTAQSAFGNAPQPHFPENNSQASFNASNTQPTFGNTTSAFFGTVAPTTASTFGSANTQTTSSSSGPIFGGMTFTFGASNQSSSGSSPFNIGTQSSSVAPATSGFSFGVGQNRSANAAVTFGIGAPSSSSAPVMSRFSFGMGQSGLGSTTVTFGSPALQSNPLSNQNQSAPFSFGTPVATEKLSFGGTSTPTFGQSTSTPVVGGLSFGTPSTPGSGFATPGPSFGSLAPAFSIGLGSKPPGSRQRLQARRQHVRKKQL